MQMEWLRGHSLGSGSFATVNVASSSNHHLPSLFAVKTCDVFTSSSLINEKQVLQHLQQCPQVIKCFGFDRTVEHGEEYCNLFLEYASGGTLYDHMKKHDGGKFPESHVRCYTKTILEGLHHIHAKGFVHCDIKLQNILVFENGDVKIADFGLAKEKGVKCEFRGTPMLMSPESFNENEHESPADIWAIGCAVVEMITGKPAWDLGTNNNVWSLLVRIGIGDEIPDIPEQLSEEGKDFLRMCFVKDPRKRFTAEMLLKHPFVSLKQEVNNEHLTSPISNFDFPDSASTLTTLVPSSSFGSSLGSPPIQFRRVETEETPEEWLLSDDWTSVWSS